MNCSACRHLGADLATVKQLRVSSSQWKNGAACLTDQLHQHEQQHSHNHPETVTGADDGNGRRPELFSFSQHFTAPFCNTSQQHNSFRAECIQIRGKSRKIN